MAIVAADLIVFSSANVPENDTTTSGGAINAASRPEFTQFTSAAIVEAVSDGADTRTLAITGRLTTGAIDTDALVLTGATPVQGVKTFLSIIKTVLSATDGSRTVSIKQGAGGTVRGTIGPNETTRHIMFISSASESGSTIRYEKVFGKNTHGTLTLTEAKVQLSADPAAKIEIGLATSKNDSGSVANRKSAPGGITFVDDGVDQSIPGDTLEAGSGIGIWVKESLGAGDAANKSTLSLLLKGNTVA